MVDFFPPRKNRHGYGPEMGARLSETSFTLGIFSSLFPKTPPITVESPIMAQWGTNNLRWVIVNWGFLESQVEGLLKLYARDNEIKNSSLLFSSLLFGLSVS
jgi:hypothetical protein